MKIVRKTVYHYTSLDVFFKILDGIKNNQLIFYASRVYELNDSTELLYGLKKIWKWLPQIEKELSINDDRYKLSKIGTDNELMSGIFPKIILDGLKKSKINPFVISFSNDKDSIPMWNMYGDKGNGVALGFDLQLEFKKDHSEFLDLTNMDGRPFSFSMSYGNYKPKDAALRFVKIEYSNYYNKVGGFANIEDIINKQLDLIDKIAFISALLLKHSSFSYERESRLFYNIIGNLNDIKFRTNSKGNVIPYVEAPIPLSLLKKIIVGPCCNASQVKKTIDLKFQQIGKDNIKIENSKVPYRDF